MKTYVWLLVIGVMVSTRNMAQRSVTDVTIMYDITVESTNTKPSIANMFNGATTTVYIKKNNHRTEQVNSLGTSTTIFDGATNTAVTLKEYGNQKILVRLNSKNWTAINKKYEGVTFTKTAETKTIAGYLCTKSVGTLADGTSFTIFSTNDIVPANKDYNLQFKNADGLVLEYEFSINGMKIINTASKVNLSPIAPAKFEVPKTGYREMTYEESIK